MMLENAGAKGADIRQGVVVRDVLTEGNQVIGVRAHNAGGGSETFRSSVVVDASGRDTLLANKLGLGDDEIEHCRTAARLAKNDLVTGTVGEFPELQGRIGGLMLDAEGFPGAVARAVFEHYQPVGPEDDVPESACGAVVALADKLDSVARFIGIGRGPTGSGDPFGLRRATSGIFRIARFAQ